MDPRAHIDQGGRISVRVTPKSRQPGLSVSVEGVAIKVRAAPEGGKATEEARRALAAALGLPPSAVSLVRGATSRTKVFQISD